jgi:hypothetical protein
MGKLAPSYPEMSQDEWFCYHMGRCEARDIIGALVDEVLSADRGIRGLAGAVILMRAWCRCDPPAADEDRWKDCLKPFVRLDIVQIAEMKWVN